jgi:hypothetical protein
LRSLAIDVPRFDSGPVSVRAIASPTTAGVCVPPGPSKCAIPDSRDGKCVRGAVVSRLTVPAFGVVRPTPARQSEMSVPPSITMFWPRELSQRGLPADVEGEKVVSAARRARKQIGCHGRIAGRACRELH